MKKGFLYLFLIGCFVLAGLFPTFALAVDFPSPPPIWEAVDNFYTWSVDAEGSLYINRVYCFVINGKTIINEFYPDNGFDYVYSYWLIERKDGQLVQEKYPNSYWFDADGDGVFSDKECLFEAVPDGWNGNEIDIYTVEGLPKEGL